MNANNVQLAFVSIVLSYRILSFAENVTYVIISNRIFVNKFARMGLIMTKIIKIVGYVIKHVKHVMAQIIIIVSAV